MLHNTGHVASGHVEDRFAPYLDSFAEDDAIAQRVDASAPVMIRGDRVETVEDFVYLSSKLCHDGSLDKEVSHRMGRAAANFHKFRKVLWDNEHVPLSTKCQMYRGAVLSTLLYSCEAWAVKQVHVRRPEVFQMGCLRQLLGVSLRDRLRNVDIRQRCGVRPIAQLLRGNRMRWFGQLCAWTMTGWLRGSCLVHVRMGSVKLVGHA